ncbi:MAG: MlaD family protein [Bdellovibrionales bacterium]|nr:MlaD family protein [Bdellovibrionales bacterium]
MSVENHKQSEYRVGLFTAGGVILLISTILVLGGERTFFGSYYDLKLSLNSVEGVNTGSVVQLSGLKVGNVEEIEFIPEKNQLVLNLKIDKRFEKRITEGSLGGMRTQGALGDKFIYITPGPVDAKPLQPGVFLETEVDKDLFSTISKRGNEIQKIFDVLNELEIFVSNLNADGGSRVVMKNLQTSTEELKSALVTLNSLLKEVKPDGGGESELKKTLRHLSSVAQKIDSGQGTLGGLINDPSLHERLKDLVGASERKKGTKNLLRSTIEKGGGD